MKEGETTHLPGWTSTSTNPTVAPQYATKDLYGGKQHLIKFHVHPGAGLSVARHSSYVNSGSDDPYNTGNGSRGEDEILLHHGTEVTKVKTETDERGNFIHHFEAHPRHLPLDQYPKEYQNPHF
jgi:hypothetical protein